MSGSFDDSSFASGSGNFDTDFVPVATGLITGYPTPVANWDLPEETKKRDAERAKRWDSEKAKTEAVRKIVRKAFGFEPQAPALPAAVAAEVRSAAEPFVEERKNTVRIDWTALNAARSALATLEQLAFEARERAMREAAEADDEEVILLAASL